jgi:hypothetical protein
MFTHNRCRFDYCDAVCVLGWFEMGVLSFSQQSPAGGVAVICIVICSIVMPPAFFSGCSSGRFPFEWVLHALPVAHATLATHDSI